ncbi:signal peptidase II [Rhizorhapis suberifaciens]|uniref:Lipoprotein signal peptidase n=1 Tax=Rhizorhapis suberifaciens TaxID=13656 RepID=A0A840HV78_9SPHN|nr:signal peptidase II [Rhizorhapis suberifaciens]MBB4641396.1 signal peptidase II [Rhizorhapis suberifaciens]
MAIRKNYRNLGIAAAATIFTLDQLIKYVVVYPLALESRQVIDLLPFFDLNFVRNYGVSMGFFRADSDIMRWALVGMTAAIAIFVGLWMWREKARDDVIALGLVLGGALGNIVDRVRFGYVVDFADFHIGNWRPFLIFNLADAAITIGVLILLARALLLRDKGGNVEKRNA